MDTVLIGADPEFFVINTHTNKPVPAHEAGFPDRNNKMKFRSGKAFRDGYAIEVNIAPSFNWYTVTSRVQSVLSDIESMLDPKGFKLLTIPAIRIDLTSLIESAPEDVLMFGCDPSLDAYTGNQKVPNIMALEHEFRYSGGHLHFSAEGVGSGSRHWSTRFEDAAMFIRMMDMYVGIPLTVIFSRQHAYQRRQYYGQAGEFRMQNYPDGSRGIEYRTPGPEVFNNAAIANMAMTAGQWVFRNFHSLKKDWPASAEPWIQHAINTGEDALMLLHELKGLYTPDMIRAVAAMPENYQLTLPIDPKPAESAWVNYTR